MYDVCCPSVAVISLLVTSLYTGIIDQERLQKKNMCELDASFTYIGVYIQILSFQKEKKSITMIYMKAQCFKHNLDNIACYKSYV